MIIFTSNPEIIRHVKRPFVYNLSSYYSGFESISDLITKINICNSTDMRINDFLYSPQFDTMYANTVLNNNQLFNSFIKIMINALNNNVVILIAHDQYRDAVTESIIKLIQVRYGYNCWEIEDVEDLDCVKDTFFTPNGLLTLDEDTKKFSALFIDGSMNPINGFKDSEF